MPGAKEQKEYEISEILLDRKVVCNNGSCNNGCQLVDITDKNILKLGASKKQTYADDLRREITVKGITVLDQDATMIGEGELNITGERRLSCSEGNRSYCHLQITKKGDIYYDPNLDEFKRLPSP